MFCLSAMIYCFNHFLPKAVFVFRPILDHQSQPNFLFSASSNTINPDYAVVEQPVANYSSTNQLFVPSENHITEFGIISGDQPISASSFNQDTAKKTSSSNLLFSTLNSKPPTVGEEVQVRALYSYVGQGEDELTFTEGIEINFFFCLKIVSNFTFSSKNRLMFEL